MDNNLFQVGLLTEEEITGTDIQLPETPKEEVPIKKEEKVVEIPAKETNKIELLSVEEAGLEEEKDEKTGETKIKPVAKGSDKEEIALDYKTLAESRIKNGAWEEYENWGELKDSVEWTPELFEKLETEQFNNKVAKAIEEEKSSLTPQYKFLLEHAKNNGNIQELLPSIQQEMDIDALDESDEDSARELVRAECEAKGWTEKRTKAYLESLTDQGIDALKETAKEAKASLKGIVDEERQNIIAEQENRAKEAKIYWEGFNKKIRESIFKDEELSSKEQKDLEKFVFDYKNVDPNTGSKYSDFNAKFEEIKSDPEKYAKFVKLVKNFDTVVKKETAKKEATKEISFLLRGAQAGLSKNKETQSPELQKNSSAKGQWNPFQLRN